MSDRRHFGGAVRTAALWTLVVVLAASTTFLLIRDQSEPAYGASTDAVALPGEIGDYTTKASDLQDILLSDTKVEFDWKQTREDYAKVLGANVDYDIYAPQGAEADSDDDPLNDPVLLGVRVVRAELPLTPGFTTENASTKIVRDDMICELASYTLDADAGPQQRPQKCTRSDDVLTVTVSAMDLVTPKSTSAPTLDELVQFTDQVYDATQ